MAEKDVPVDEIMARFEELSALEAEFEDVELDIIRKAEALHTPLYKKRAELIEKIPHFWALVFEQAPPEIDNFIQPSDAQVFAGCLETLQVSRFEINDPKGSPRSFSLKFGFQENEYFEDKTIEKKFWYRRTKDWEGLVSEPAPIHWKKGKDLTNGLLDAACKLSEARKQLKTDTADVASRKKETKLPEYKAVAEAIEGYSDSSISFFGIFGFVSGYRWVSAEESEKATHAEKERIAKIKRGEKVDDEEEDKEDDEDPLDYQEIEVFPGGDEVATIIAEDMWPNAIKYYKQIFDEEVDDEELSEIDLSEGEDPMEEDDSDSAAEVDIRALVGKGRLADNSPPVKKQRKG